MHIDEDELVNLLFWGSFFIATIKNVSESDRKLLRRIGNVIRSRRDIPVEDCGVTGYPILQPGEGDDMDKKVDFNQLWADELNGRVPAGTYHTELRKERTKNKWHFRGVIEDVHPSVKIGIGTSVWSFAVILEQTVIGENCAIGSSVYIGRRCIIGNNVRIQDKVHITDDTIIEDDVFVGPGVVTMDARYPKSGQPYKHEPPYFEKGCSIGAGAVILPGRRIGSNALVGAGAVVTKDVIANSVVIGVPSREMIGERKDPEGEAP